MADDRRTPGSLEALSAAMRADANFNRLGGYTSEYLRARIHHWADDLDAVATVLRRETEQQGVAKCSFCGWEYRYAVGSPEQETAWVFLATHVRQCKDHPLVQRAERSEEKIAKLEKELAKAEGNAIHGWSEVDHQRGHKEDYVKMLETSEAENERLKAALAVLRRSEGPPETDDDDRWFGTHIRQAIAAFKKHP